MSSRSYIQSQSCGISYPW